MTDIAILDWKLVRLTIDQVGPFQDTIETFDFTGPGDADGSSKAPANLFMLLAKNGKGKTTVLECIHGIMGLLAEPPVGRFADPNETGRVQADFRVRWRKEREERTVLLSIWVGSPDPLLTPDDVQLEGISEDTEWVRLAIGRNPQGPFLMEGTSDDALQLFRQIRSQAGRAPGALLGGSQMLPTVLLFTADRAVYRPVQATGVERPLAWGYSPAQTFRSDGPAWRDSIDNLLVWLDWLGDGRIEQLLSFVNPKLFLTDEKYLKPPHRETLQASVVTPNGLHSLAALSHGERAILQLFVRVACHMTGNTIILIDEIETHLHSRYMHRMFIALKLLIASEPRLSIIFTTHSRDLMRVFNHELVEDSITKGGFLIEDDIS